VELRASDNGVGIPLDQRKSIFRPFSRIERAGEVSPSGGMGIGLHVVRSLVEAHGGEVGAIEPPSGRGATIRIRFPKQTTAETAA
jgi:signal transduction histidine kinase